jgi:hypothetical protein
MKQCFCGKICNDLVPEFKMSSQLSTSLSFKRWNFRNNAETKEGPEYVLKDPKKTNEWRRLIMNKLKPQGFAKDTQNAVTALLSSQEA